jgi:curved DNA-binding protein CbpA
MFKLHESLKKLNKGFKRLFEARPPTGEEIAKAYEVFGLKPGDDLSNLDSLWKALARKNHPDLGGDPEKMKEINAAKDILSQFGSSSYAGTFSSYGSTYKRTTPEERAEQDKKLLAINRKIADGIMSIMKSASISYEKYLKRSFPDIEAKEPKDLSNKDSVYITYTWATKDGSTSFSLIIRSGWGHQKSKDHTLGGGSSEENYEVMFETKMYHNGKTYKVSQQKYSFNKLSGQLGKPSEIFPDKALKRVSSQSRGASKMQARDFRAALENEFDGFTRGKDIWLLPVSDTRALQINRHVMLKTGLWSILGLRDKKSADARSYEKMIPFNTAKHSTWMTEDLRTLKILKEIMKLLKDGKQDQVEKILNDYKITEE